MMLQLTFDSITLLCAALLALNNARIAWGRRVTPGRNPFVAAMIAVAVWSAFGVLGSLAVDLGSKVLWAKLEYLGILNLPPLFLIFALEYGRQSRRLSHRALAALWGLPLVTFLLVLTNENHGLIWNSIVASSTPGSRVIFGHGLWFWAIWGYNYVLLLAASYVLIRTALGTPSLFRLQTFALLLGVAAPWLGNLLYVTGSLPIPGLDPAPLMFALSGLLWVWTIFRFHLLDLAPIAREAVVEHMRDGLVVLDPQDRIVDMNLAAQDWVDAQGAPVGQPVASVFAAWPELAAALSGPGADRTALPIGDPPRFLDLQSSPLIGPLGRMTGRTITWRDVTERERAQLQTRESEHRYRLLAENMSDVVWVLDPVQWKLDYVSPSVERMRGFSPDQVLAQSMAEMMTRDSLVMIQATMPERLHRWKNEPSHPSFFIDEIEQLARNGSTVWTEVSSSIISDDKGQIRIVGVSRDISKRKQAQSAEREQRLFAEALSDTAAVANSTLDLDQVLDHILANIERVVPHDAANIMLLDEHGTAYVARAQGYAERGRLDMMLLRVKWQEIATLQTMADTGRPVSVCDVRQSDAPPVYPGGTWVCSYAGAAMRVQNRVIGFINLDSAVPGFYGPEHARRLLAFANQAAIALENARLYALVQHNAVTDELTGVFNRRGLFELGSREIERAVRYGRRFSLVLLDLDFFKPVNDRYGHLIGDQVLRGLAQLCSKRLRKIDIFARYGGEEFAALLPETEGGPSCRVAERLRQAVAETAFATDAGDIRITVSAGVAEWTNETTDLAALIACADQALYQAKHSGRNRTASWSRTPIDQY